VGPVNRLFYSGGGALARLLCKLCFRFRVRGEAPPERGPIIAAANHESFLDPLVLQLAMVKHRLRYMVASPFYHHWLLNRFCNAMRCIPVAAEGSKRESLRLALEVLAAGHSIGIFPQGGRMRPGDLAGASGGVAFLARKSGVPVVPARILGAGAALPIGAHFIRPVRVEVVLGRPLRFGGAEPRLDLPEITAAIMDSIAQLDP